MLENGVEKLVLFGKQLKLLYKLIKFFASNLVSKKQAPFFPDKLEPQFKKCFYSDCFTASCRKG